MLKIKETNFEVMNSELHLKKRTYQGISVVSLEAQVNFYPKLVGDQITSGGVQVVVDLEGIHALDDFSNQTYTGPGKVELSLNENGDWSYETSYEFTLSFGKRQQNHLSMTLENNLVTLELPVTIVSLYLVNQAGREVDFDLTDFYEIPIRKTIGGKEIQKYIVRGE